MNCWLFLLAAILLEVVGTTAMKLSRGFVRPLPSVLIFVFYLLSLTNLTLALREIEVSTAYAIWSGLGTVLISVVGVVIFRESMTARKAAAIVLILLGTVTLQLQAG